MKQRLLQFIYFIGRPFTFLAAYWFKGLLAKRINDSEDKMLMKIGVLPVGDHYYQPLINPKKHLKYSLRKDRILTGIDFNIEEQLQLLSSFNYQDELLQFPTEGGNSKTYFYNNRSFGSGDGEYLYNMIRHFKPRKLIEIGSGNSTLMARNAITKNSVKDLSYHCEHICIEPFEEAWLENLDIELIREKVETLDRSIFQQLNANDILFVDSSHIIRPQGDVLYIIQQLLGSLKKGVIIHFHDIFSPKDYPDAWIMKKHWLWNEQYLLEAFLSHNDSFKIIASVNYLAHYHQKELKDKCPVYARQENREPGSFWIQKIK